MDKPLVLWGGVDINPERYGQRALGYTQQPNNQRDQQEFASVYRAVKDGTPIIGICRGAQLLCVANGGTLYQHSLPHKHNHSIMVSDKRWLGEGDVLIENVQAGHHQIMQPTGNYIVYGWNPLFTYVWDKEGERRKEINAPEVVWFPDIKGLAIQPHPEWMDTRHPFNVWLNTLTKELGIDYEF